MPNYKTHSIHGEMVLPSINSINKRVNISKEDIKSFCLGPDALVVTDYKTFDISHANNTRSFFCTLIREIKKRGLQGDPETMAFLYGQIDHFVLDLTIHPLIYYMTEGIKQTRLMAPHALVENWIDDYTSIKSKRNQLLYYRKWVIRNRNLISLITDVYNEVYGATYEGYKYSLGMIATSLYDTFARRNLIGVAPLVASVSNLGDIFYRKDYNRALPYLNLERDIWLNPETGEEYRESFDDLWKKSVEDSLETIDDVNRCIYQGKPLTNPLIAKDLSCNTGLSCKNGQKLIHVKKCA